MGCLRCLLRAVKIAWPEPSPTSGCARASGRLRAVFGSPPARPSNCTPASRSDPCSSRVPSSPGCGRLPGNWRGSAAGYPSTSRSALSTRPRLDDAALAKRELDFHWSRIPGQEQKQLAEGLRASPAQPWRRQFPRPMIRTQPVPLSTLSKRRSCFAARAARTRISSWTWISIWLYSESRACSP